VSPAKTFAEGDCSGRQVEAPTMESRDALSRPMSDVTFPATNRHRLTFTSRMKREQQSNRIVRARIGINNDFLRLVRRPRLRRERHDKQRTKERDGQQSRKSISSRSNSPVLSVTI